MEIRFILVSLKNSLLKFKNCWLEYLLKLTESELDQLLAKSCLLLSVGND